MSRPVRIPSYRLHKPSGQAIVTIRGRMFYLGPFGSVASRAEYGRIIAEWQSGPPKLPPASSTQPAVPADLTVAELFRSYFHHCEQYYVKNGVVTNQARMIHLALEVANRLYGHVPCREFGPVALKACRAEFMRTLSRGECNRRTNLIKQAFRWATENELIPAGVFHALQSVAGLRKGRCEARETAPIGPVADEVVDRTIEHLSTTVAAMVSLQRASGMRPQEVVVIRAIDIDMSDPSCWVYRPGTHKTEHHSKARVIFFGPRAIETLSPFLLLNIGGFLFSPVRADAERAESLRARRKTPLWDSHVARLAKERGRRGRRSSRDRYDVASYRRAVARACDRAFPHPTLAGRADKDLDDAQRAELEAWRKAHRWHPHQLRHSAATAIRRRFGIEGAQAVLGHSELSATEIYAEKDLEAARAIMKAIG